MPGPAKKFRIIGELRPKLDVKRFADALIALAVHRLSSKPQATSDQAEVTDAKEPEMTS